MIVVPENEQPHDSLPDRPSTRPELARWVQTMLGLRIPSRAVCRHHRAPLDYLAASFLDSRRDDGADLLVWANRGGGKTLLAAVASLLDGLYNAPVDVRILGGSFDQSDRLAEHLRNFLTGGLAAAARGQMTRTRIRLATGADIRMLSQSQRAVRGQHAQKIRCDEVDLFDPDVWRALQFVTRSSQAVRGGIEVFSTLHRPGGLMEQLVESARSGSGGGGFRLIPWCLWEVIERCPPQRRCRNCPLEEDCRGKARRAEGFFKIEDAIAIKARSSRQAWAAEMLCRGAKRDWLVFGEFDPAVHVGEVSYCADFRSYRAIDFGYAAPFVCLWVQVSPGGQVHVLDEYVRARRSIAQHAAEILRRDPGKGASPSAPIVATYVDPAGRARESTSGAACTELLAAAGIPCAWRRASVAEGLELIRAALAPATGEPALKISPRCRNLIEAFRTYHYPEPGSIGRGDRPVKDGPDHLIDALRYFFVNRMRPGSATKRTRY